VRYSPLDGRDRWLQISFNVISRLGQTVDSGVLTRRKITPLLFALLAPEIESAAAE
jgi:hypothetical protein